MTKWMNELWNKVKTNEVYRSWPGGALLTGLFRQSFYDTTPGLTFLANLIGGTHGGKTGF